MNEDRQDRSGSDSGLAFTWHLDAASFNEALIELLRKRDTVLPRASMDEIARDLIELIPSCDSEQENEIVKMLDRLAVIGLESLRFGHPALFDSFVRTSLNIYVSGFDENGNARRHSPGKGISASALWLHVVTRLFAVGAYAVRLEEWAAVRKLALQTLQGIPYMTESEHWLRHAVTHSSREDLLDLPDRGVVKGGELISLVQMVIDAEPALRCDLPQSDPRLMNSILQFDLLALLVVSANLGVYNTSYVYPSMAGWGLRRAEPIVVKLLSDADMREKLVGEVLDERLLATILKEVQQYALRLNFSHEMGWSNQHLRELSRRARE